MGPRHPLPPPSFPSRWSSRGHGILRLQIFLECLSGFHCRKPSHLGEGGERVCNGAGSGGSSPAGWPRENLSFAGPSMSCGILEGAGEMFFVISPVAICCTRPP